MDSAPSATAREKYECPACGADAHWNAARQALVCPFCGTESPYQVTASGATWPRNVSRRRPARSSGQDARVENARGDDGDIPSLQFREGAIERRMIEQRVPTCDQRAVEREFVRRL